MFAVGALAAIQSVVAAHTLTARDPLRERREQVRGIVRHPASKRRHPLSGLDLEPSTLIWSPGCGGQMVTATIISISRLGAVITHLTSPILRPPQLHPACLGSESANLRTEIPEEPQPAQI